MTTNEKKQPRGGVIPYFIENGTIQMMFMRPSDPTYGGKRYQIAKGKIEKGETPEEGAFREASEELGLFKPNIVRSESLGQFGTVHMFLAKIKDPNMFGDTTDETGAVIWWSPEEFQSNGRDWQKPIVKAAVRKINKLEDYESKNMG
jgi:8-oxo-dGTP pyrophosphatase MutT (NUDIX family)